MTIPWAAIAQTLPLEGEGGRQYVHFAALWFWLKLGILGLCAYVSVMVASMWLACPAWRASREPLLRAFVARVAVRRGGVGGDRHDRELHRR